MQNPCQLAHWHTCCTSCKTRANFGRASCWHECCTPCKTHANSGHGTNVAHKQNTCQLLSCKSRANSYPQVIHRLPHAILVPTLRPSKTRANFGHAKVMPMLGRGRGLTCVNYSCSHLSTPEGKFKKKIGTIHVTYVLPSALFYLVFASCGHKCTKSVHWRDN